MQCNVSHQGIKQVTIKHNKETVPSRECYKTSEFVPTNSIQQQGGTKKQNRIESGRNSKHPKSRLR